MIVFVDSSALAARYVDDHRRPAVLRCMDEGPWVVSAATRAETALVLRWLATGERQSERFERHLAADWDACHVVPVDERCLRRAAEIGAGFGLPLALAIQLAAADRVPRPVRFLTLDDRLVAPAVALDLEVVPSGV